MSEKKEKSKNKDELMNEAMAAGFIGISSGTLKLWRYKGIGPRHLEPKPQTIRYWKSDIVDWMEGRI